MVEVKGTNAQKKALIEKAEKEGRELTKEELLPFESDSILDKQKRAETAQMKAIGNARLAARNVPSVKIQECKF